MAVYLVGCGHTNQLAYKSSIKTFNQNLKKLQNCETVTYFQIFPIFVVRSDLSGSTSSFQQAASTSTS